MFVGVWSGLRSSLLTKVDYPFTYLLSLSSLLREPFANPGSVSFAALPPPRSVTSLLAPRPPLPLLFHVVSRPRVPCRLALARFPALQPPRRFDVFIRRSSRRYRYSPCCTPCCSARRSSLRLLPSPLFPADPDFFTTHAADEQSLGRASHVLQQLKIMLRRFGLAP